MKPRMTQKQFTILMTIYSILFLAMIVMSFAMIFVLLFSK